MISINDIGAVLILLCKAGSQRQDFVLILGSRIHATLDFTNFTDCIMIFRQQRVQLCQRILQRRQIALQSRPICLKLLVGLRQHLTEQALTHRPHVAAHRPHAIDRGNRLICIFHIDCTQICDANHGHNPHDDDHRQNRTKTSQKFTSKFPVSHVNAPSLSMYRFRLSAPQSGCPETKFVRSWSS